MINFQENDCLKEIFSSYKSNSFDVLKFRKTINKKYALPVQQDVAEFIMDICEKSKLLKSVIEYEHTTEIFCQNCKKIQEETTNNIIIRLTIPSIKKIFKLQEIINDNINNYKNLDINCNDCQIKLQNKTKVFIARHRIVILQLVLFCMNKSRKITKRTQCKIENIFRSNIYIGNKIYKVTNAIFHYGPNIDSGHYTTMIKQNNTWFTVEDSKISKSHWPKCSKDMYIIFLEEIP